MGVAAASRTDRVTKPWSGARSALSATGAKLNKWKGAKGRERGPLSRWTCPRARIRHPGSVIGVIYITFIRQCPPTRVSVVTYALISPYPDWLYRLHAVAASRHLVPERESSLIFGKSNPITRLRPARPRFSLSFSARPPRAVWPL